MTIVPRSQFCKHRLDNERMLLLLNECAELALCSFIMKLISNEIFLHLTSILQILHNSCRCRISFSLRPSPSALSNSRSLSSEILLSSTDVFSNTTVSTLSFAQYNPNSRYYTAFALIRLSSSHHSCSSKSKDSYETWSLMLRLQLDEFTLSSISNPSSR